MRRLMSANVDVKVRDRFQVLVVRPFGDELGVGGEPANDVEVAVEALTGAVIGTLRDGRHLWTLGGEVFGGVVA